MKETVIQKGLKRCVAILSAVCMCKGLAVPSYADTGVTVKVTGADKLDGYAVTGTYYNIGSSESVQTVVTTDANGNAYFALPTKEYTNFDFTMMVQGFEITGAKDVTEIKQESKAEISNDISWAVALGAFNDDSANIDDPAMNYNEIAADGTAQGTVTDTPKTDITDKPISDNKVDNSRNDANTVNKRVSTVYLNIESQAETYMLREEVTVTLSGVNGSASFKATLGAENSSSTVNLPDGVYNVRASETSNKTVFPSECTIVKGECTLKATLKPVSTLKVLNGTETDTLFKIRSGNTSGTLKITQTVAVEPKRSYVVNIVDQPTKYNLMIPTAPNDYIFDFATGELTIDRPDKSTEIITGTEDNPFGIAETMDKGYVNTQTKPIVPLFDACVGLVCIVLVCIVLAIISKVSTKKNNERKTAI